MSNIRDLLSIRMKIKNKENFREWKYVFAFRCNKFSSFQMRGFIMDYLWKADLKRIKMKRRNKE